MTTIPLPKDFNNFPRLDADIYRQLPRGFFYQCKQSNYNIPFSGSLKHNSMQRFKAMVLWWNNRSEARRKESVEMEDKLISDNISSIVGALTSCHSSNNISDIKRILHNLGVTPSGMWLIILAARINDSNIIYRFQMLDEEFHNLPNSLFGEVVIPYSEIKFFGLNKTKLMHFVSKIRDHYLIVDLCLAMAPMLLSVDVIVWISEYVAPSTRLYDRRNLICRICDPFFQQVR